MNNFGKIWYYLNSFSQLNLLWILGFIVSAKTYSSATQILNDNFYQNPAELSLVRKTQLILGNLYINPQFKFTGDALKGNGQAQSSVNDFLPYLLTAHRFTDRLVFGFNITPSGYGHLKWPNNSIVSYDSTVTHVLYYRAAVQASYQISEKMSLGAGFNFEYNKLAELNFIVPGLGNQTNKVKGFNYTGDVGVFYKINAQNYLTAAIYTPVVNASGFGTSTLNTAVNNNLSLNITEACVLFFGIQHVINEKWFVEGKIYWSDWTIQKNIYFINTTTGDSIVPTDWKKTWSFQVSNRYTLNDKLGLLTNILYETNPGPLVTNAIGYPLSATGSLSVGLDVTLQKELSAQALYGYGTFLPNSQIHKNKEYGSISANIHAAVLQLSYKA